MYNKHEKIDSDQAPPQSHSTADTLRTMSLGIFLLGAAGSAIELFLLEHTASTQQWIPLVLLVLSLFVVAWHAFDRGPSTMRIFQITMALFIISGIVGTILHYQANVAATAKATPTLEGVELFRQALKGEIPSLAPGTMIELGLIGLVYTYRHPALIKVKEDF